MTQNTPRVTLRSIAENINLNWSLDDWLQWPPDAFALCSIIINRTGLYKYFLLNTSWWHTPNWTKDIDELSDTWIRVASNRLLDSKHEIVFYEKEPLRKYYGVLQKEWMQPSIEIDHLRVLSNIFDKKRVADKEFVQAVLYVAIVADATCGGLGFLGQPLVEQQLSHRIFMGVANILLNNTGTLSTISKQHGVVLPKMRTPQAGMTVRAMTHHLTFHITEVEVIWRTFPLLDKGINEWNILAVPYPYEVADDDLRARPDDGQAVRYFEPKIAEKESNDQFIRKLVNWVGRSALEGNEVDIIVLPEMALTHEEYTRVLKWFEVEFVEKNRCKRLPIIVTGMTKANPNTYGVPSIDEPFQNEARIAVFFAGKWYTTTQRKHHRWQLDKSQITQYGLEAQFAGDRLWFEYCTASQRRMTVMAPNDQLAITALICEDLAQQEPLSEIIRGVGPSLLLALLSDGPQLRERWSARYAGVLASDPGTAVLSLTSLGMSLRSKNLKNASAAPIPQVGLWRDMRITKDLLFTGEKRDAILFSITSTTKEEYTLDGRSDGNVASFLHWINDEAKIDEISLEVPYLNSEEVVADKTSLKGEFENLRELSALQFAIDAILEVLIHHNLPSTTVDSATDLFLNLLTGAKRFNSPKRKFRAQIFVNMRNAWDDPHLVGISASAAKDSENMMEVAVLDLKTLINDLTGKKTNVLESFDNIIDVCERHLHRRIEQHSDLRTFMSVLYNLHNRVRRKDTEGKLIITTLGISMTDSVRLSGEINRIINQVISKKQSNHPAVLV